jgi:hypothetical protein
MGARTGRLLATHCRAERQCARAALQPLIHPHSLQTAGAYCPAGVRIMSTNEPSPSTPAESAPDTQTTMHSPIKPVLWMLLVLALLILFGVMTN